MAVMVKDENLFDRDRRGENHWKKTIGAFSFVPLPRGLGISRKNRGSERPCIFRAPGKPPS
ncbi:MAG: hypothetical protein LBI87_03780 [Candidatus Accumulibacter sp.]|jgi:hypothetical protein|nr:hypothetical protein [Accumulibacter sp.]